MNTLFLEKRVNSLIEFLKGIFVVAGYIAQIFAHVFNKLSIKAKVIQTITLFSFISIVILTQIAPVLGIYTFVIGGIIFTIIMFAILAIRNI
jgi:hypothetical protein